MNEEEITTRALESWPAAEPPPGFAERVLAARTPHPRGRLRRRVALAAGVVLIAGAAALISHQRGPATGQSIASSRETIPLGRRGLAVAEAGTHLSWAVSAAGEARIEQASGDAFYRVEPGGPFVVAAPGADVTATGTCFRVEVVSMATTMENTRAALLGAAAASLVLVTVYEGQVRVQQKSAAAGRGVVELNAGEQSRFPVPAAASLTTPLPQQPAAIARAAAPSPPALAANDPVAMRARISQLEAQVAKLSTGKSAEPPWAIFEKVRGFTPDELREMAKTCQLVMGAPAYGSTAPTFDPNQARKLSVPASEVEQINQILAAQNTEFTRSMRELYLAATGDTAGADQLDAATMEHEMMLKAPPEQNAAARQEIALENAGLASPPANSAGEPVITRVLRLHQNAGPKLHEALAASLGSADADHVIDAVTPMHMSLNGCPSEAR